MGRFSDNKHRLTIQQPVPTQDQTTGELVNAWTTIGTVWASIHPVRGREALRGEQMLAETDTKICVRWGPLTQLITSTHRGMHQGTVFNFVYVLPVKMANREIEILAKSGVNDG